ncbi:MAG: DUF1489 domain-containing protein [Neomegalonema sp.]|nr:DUF1489 domain-containing protein [Neomegalonema sp.]
MGGPGELNLIKLCVGTDSVEDLAAWRAQMAAERVAAGLAPRVAHRTRQTPRRSEELLAGGSIYWVMKGRILARQSLRAIEEAEDGPGVDLVLDPQLILTRPQPRRPFQGWRYLIAADAPQDVGPYAVEAGAGAEAELPAVLREEIASYGVV